MKLIICASVLVVAAAAAPQVVPTPLLANPQAFPGVNNPYYQGGYRGYEASGYNRGPYDPKNYPGYYDQKNYGKYYDQKNYDQYYNPKNYDQYYNSKNYGQYYDPKNYNQNYNSKNYGQYYNPKNYGLNYDPKYYNQYQQHVPILEQSSEVNPDGTFRYSYATADGQQARAEGIVKQSDLDPQDVANVIRGSYSYTAPDGTPVSYNYIADEYGFRVDGSHVHNSHNALHKRPVDGAFDKIYQNQYNPYYKQYPQRYYGKSLALTPDGVPVPVADADSVPVPVVPQK